ncbi:hypothetical protein CDD81_4431 [Ophiocordyceps australis]|uniref:Uncharacterized protein n=1 Tax=Ophiocordyceps australis TaxID=1399860 RepID=A0A2C5YH50_9HYPO|nr:hypothetical protein CDD81_4431 [Ophiocordyceps australis]
MRVQGLLALVCCLAAASAHAAHRRLGPWLARLVSTAPAGVIMTDDKTTAIVLAIMDYFAFGLNELLLAHAPGTEQPDSSHVEPPGSELG